MIYMQMARIKRTQYRICEEWFSNVTIITILGVLLWNLIRAQYYTQRQTYGKSFAPKPVMAMSFERKSLPSVPNRDWERGVVLGVPTPSRPTRTVCLR